MLVEAAMAQRLLSASDVERPALYGDVYDRIYQMHFARSPEVLEFGASPALLPFLEQVTKPGQRVLEVGCGTGMLSAELARRGRVVTGVDVSEVALEIARARSTDAADVTFELARGFDVGEPESFDFAFSVEVLEHLHARDASAHLAGVSRALKRGGAYWSLTPHAHATEGAADRFGVAQAAPGDVHLKEWTYAELTAALRRAGFVDLQLPFPVSRRPMGRRTRFASCRWQIALERAPMPVQRHRVVVGLLGRLGINANSCCLLAHKPWATRAVDDSGTALSLRDQAP